MIPLLLTFVVTNPFVGEPVTIKTGYGFTEGPTWTGTQFVFCDMANDTVLAWKPGDAEPKEIRKPSGKAVGSASDGKGMVFQVDTTHRQIVSWKESAPSEAKVLANSYDGKKLGGMNDLALHSNGSVYVTHANWFVSPDSLEFEHSGVIRVDQKGKVSLLTPGLSRPNGIAFHKNRAYVTEYSAGRIMSFEIGKDGAQTDEATLFADLNALAKEKGIDGQGGADGIRCDRDGNIFSTGPGGIWALSPKGSYLGHLPFRGTNIALGGKDGKTMLITTGRGVAWVALK
ncbi:MAG: SMP-30/gluconolactonase/LRE family protein [Fimbriimonadaceae bacterium]|nr:SMP-30/gluconolactonase/LRE family protein [Fimbriimonadaceae bacterium]